MSEIILNIHKSSSKKIGINTYPKTIYYLIKKIGLTQIFGKNSNKNWVDQDFVSINKNKCYLLIDNIKVELCYEYDFKTLGKHKVQIIEIEPIENMMYMFFGLNENNVEIDLSNYWDVSRVKNMMFMFSLCSSLISLRPLSFWNVSSVKNMMFMFTYCSKLTSLYYISKWNICSVKNTMYMFGWCSNLTSLDSISKWDISSIQNMMNMFSSCPNLSSLETLSKWDLSSVQNVFSMFFNCNKLNIDKLPPSWPKIKAFFDKFPVITFIDLNNKIKSELKKEIELELNKK